jgi:hypothetical protein
MKRIISISICMVFLLSASTILPTQEKVEKRKTFEELEIEAKGMIKDRNDKLEIHFNAGEYEEMAAIFPDNARLVTHEGEVIPGKESENYWRRVGVALEGTDMKFKNKLFDAIGLALPSGYTKDDFDFVAIDVTEFSFKVNNKKYEGYVDPPLRHRVRCTWH